MAHFTISGLDDVAARPLAIVRTQPEPGELGGVIMASLAAVNEFLADAAVSQDGHNVVVYRGADVEIGAQVSGTFEAVNGVAPSVSPAGTAAHAVFHGDYADLGEAHAALRWWCAEHGHTPTGVTWEVYGDWADDSAERRTDVYAQIGPSVRPARPAPAPARASAPSVPLQIESDEGVVPTLIVALGLLLMLAGVFMNWQHATIRLRGGALTTFIARASDVPLQFLVDHGTRAHDPSLLVILLPALGLGIAGLVRRSRALLFTCSGAAIVVSALYALQAIGYLDELNRRFRGVKHFAYPDVVAEGLWLTVAGAVIVLITARFVKPRTSRHERVG